MIEINIDISTERLPLVLKRWKFSPSPHSLQKKKSENGQHFSNKSYSSSRVHTSNKQLPVWALIVTDVAITGVCLCVFALFHHVLPRAHQSPVTEIPRPSSSQAENSAAPSESDVIDPNDWRAKFADKFSDTLISTDTTYRSKNCAITIDKQSVTDANGRPITYYVADIYIAAIENFRTAFAKDTYGRSFTEQTLDMAKRNNAILAISGDYYGIRDTGVVIRNGELYRSDAYGEVCVLYYDGTMETYKQTEFNIQNAIDKGAYQAWNFGPALLNNGEAMTSFDSTLIPKNPRSAIGYYEPGHYVFVLVDGRQDGYSSGMTLSELSQLFADLGCKVAYNLDGGQTSVMTFGDHLANQPYRGGRRVSDILYIGETE